MHEEVMQRVGDWLRQRASDTWPMCRVAVRSAGSLTTRWRLTA